MPSPNNDKQGPQIFFRRAIKPAAVLIKVLITAGLAWYAFAKIDLQSAVGTMRSIAPRAVAGALVLFFLQMLMAAVRLRELIRAFGPALGIGKTLNVVLIGYFFSQAFISFVGGDAMRVWRLRQLGIPLSSGAKAVFLDRVAGFVAMVVLLFVATPFLISLIRSQEMIYGLLSILLVLPAALLVAFLLRRLPPSVAVFKPIALAKDLADSAIRIWRSPRGAATLAGASIAIQVGNVLILYVMAIGLGLDLSLFNGFLLFPAVLFLSMMPISFAGWGVREGAMVVALALVGIPAHQSVALSVCFGLAALLISLPGGLVWLAARQKPVTQLLG